MCPSPIVFMGMSLILIFISIIFIHGLTGDRERTWTAPGASSPWPGSLLPQKLPNARVLTFGYDAYIVDWKGLVSKSRVANHAMDLLTSLANFRDETSTASTIRIT